MSFISTSDFFRYKLLYSTYAIGIVTREWIEHMNDILGNDLAPSHENHKELFDQFIIRHTPTLAEWLKESQVSFTGIIEPKSYNSHTFHVKIVFYPDSQDEVLFRLRFPYRRDGT